MLGVKLAVLLHDPFRDLSVNDPLLPSISQRRQEQDSLQGTLHLRTGPARPSTKRWPCALVLTMRWSTGAMSSATKTPSMSTLNGSSSGNATSTAPSILFLGMQQWSFKTVASMRAGPWTYRRTPSRPKTERTQIRTPASPSTVAGYWQPQILPPTNRPTGLIWAVHGNSTHGLSTCNLTLGTTYTQLGGLSGIQHLPWTHCTMEST